MSHPYDPTQEPPALEPIIAQPYPPQPALQMQQYALQAMQPLPTASPKSPGVGAILSILVPGMGHLYSGNPWFAVMWFSAAFVSGLMMLVVIGFFMLPLVYIGAAIHAYHSTKAFNTRHHVIL